MRRRTSWLLKECFCLCPLSLPPVPSPTVPPQIEGDSLTSLTFKGHGEKVRVNGTLTLSCLAKGFPEPKVNWFKDGQVLGTDARTGQTRDEQIRGTVQGEGEEQGGGQRVRRRDMISVRPGY